jgi:hypothetical protein
MRCCPVCNYSCLGLGRARSAKPLRYAATLSAHNAAAINTNATLACHCRCHEGCSSFVSFAREGGGKRSASCLWFAMELDVMRKK